MIPQRNLSLIANELKAANGRRIPEAVIEAATGTGVVPDRLGQSCTLPRRTCFQGWHGAAAITLPVDYRFSEDLDFTLTAADGL